jgi:hypothetical protein
VLVLIAHPRYTEIWEAGHLPLAKIQMAKVRFIRASAGAVVDVALVGKGKKAATGSP